MNCTLVQFLRSARSGCGATTYCLDVKALAVAATAAAARAAATAVDVNVRSDLTV
jgi:hypothetical protein